MTNNKINHNSEQNILPQTNIITEKTFLQLMKQFWDKKVKIFYLKNNKSVDNILKHSKIKTKEWIIQFFKSFWTENNENFRGNVPIDLGSGMQRLNKSKIDEHQFFNKNNKQFIKKEMWKQHLTTF